jgi:hypothetical protein
MLVTVDAIAGTVLEGRVEARPRPRGRRPPLSRAGHDGDSPR